MATRRLYRSFLKAANHFDQLPYGRVFLTSHESLAPYLTTLYRVPTLDTNSPPSQAEREKREEEQAATHPWSLTHWYLNPSPSASSHDVITRDNYLSCRQMVQTVFRQPALREEPKSKILNQSFELLRIITKIKEETIYGSFNTSLSNKTQPAAAHSTTSFHTLPMKSSLVAQPTNANAAASSSSAAAAASRSSSPLSSSAVSSTSSLASSSSSSTSHSTSAASTQHSSSHVAPTVRLSKYELLHAKAHVESNVAVALEETSGLLFQALDAEREMSSPTASPSATTTPTMTSQPQATLGRGVSSQPNLSPLSTTAAATISSVPPSSSTSSTSTTSPFVRSSASTLSSSAASTSVDTAGEDEQEEHAAQISKLHHSSYLTAEQQKQYLLLLKQQHRKVLKEYRTEYLTFKPFTLTNTTSHNTAPVIFSMDIYERYHLIQQITTWNDNVRYMMEVNNQVTHSTSSLSFITEKFNFLHELQDQVEELLACSHLSSHSSTPTHSTTSSLQSAAQITIKTLQQLMAKHQQTLLQLMLSHTNKSGPIHTVMTKEQLMACCIYLHPLLFQNIIHLYYENDKDVDLLQFFEHAQQSHYLLNAYLKNASGETSDIFALYLSRQSQVELLITCAYLGNIRHALMVLRHTSWSRAVTTLAQHKMGEVQTYGQLQEENQPLTDVNVNIMQPCHSHETPAPTVDYEHEEEDEQSDSLPNDLLVRAGSEYGSETIEYDDQTPQASQKKSAQSDGYYLANNHIENLSLQDELTQDSRLMELTIVAACQALLSDLEAREYEAEESVKKNQSSGSSFDMSSASNLSPSPTSTYSFLTSPSYDVCHPFHIWALLSQFDIKLSHPHTVISLARVCHALSAIEQFDNLAIEFQHSRELSSSSSTHLNESERWSHSQLLEYMQLQLDAAQIQSDDYACLRALRLMVHHHVYLKADDFLPLFIKAMNNKNSQSSQLLNEILLLASEVPSINVDKLIHKACDSFESSHQAKSPVSIKTPKSHHETH